MTLREELIYHIKKCGVKKNFVANEVGMTPSKFSLYLHGKFIPEESVLKRIRKFLDNK